MRITAYEEGGKFIGHRVLPVIGLCPGYRHVNLRNELGQPLLMATLFLCIVVKDYVPDGFSEFAEALANPIKYQSELEKRETQLAVLTDDTEPIPEDDSICESSQASAGGGGGGKSKADTLPRGQQSFTDGGQGSSAGGGLENGGESSSGGLGSSSVDHHQSVSGASHNVSGSGNASSSATGGASSSSAVPTTSQGNVSVVVVSSEPATSVAAASSSSSKSLEAIEADAMKAEPLECILAHKAVREKRQEMEKKLESLRKKHDKEKLRICSTPKSGESSDKKSKFNMGNKLVKRLSSKSM